MIGYRVRLGFLLPPGNPMIELEMIAMCPQGVSQHFNRMVARSASLPLDPARRMTRIAPNQPSNPPFISRCAPILMATCCSSEYTSGSGQSLTVHSKCGLRWVQVPGVDR
jgi:maleate isomerase